MRRIVIQTVSEREGGNIYQRWESEPLPTQLSKEFAERIVELAKEMNVALARRHPG